MTYLNESHYLRLLHHLSSSEEVSAFFSAKFVSSEEAEEKIENIIRYETSSSETSKSSHSEIIHQNQFFRQQARSQVFRLSA
tara:strand:- start:324 stop:569 length:246 start_codon:yes stop_codon:yes gene_type:complete